MLLALSTHNITFLRVHDINLHRIFRLVYSYDVWVSLDKLNVFEF